MVNRLTGTLGVCRNPKKHLNRPSCHYKPLKKPFFASSFGFSHVSPRGPHYYDALWQKNMAKWRNLSVIIFGWSSSFFFFLRNKFITGLIGYADVDRLLEKQYINAPYVTLFFFFFPRACRIQNVGADSTAADEFIVNVSWQTPESILDQQKTVAVFPE